MTTRPTTRPTTTGTTETTAGTTDGAPRRFAQVSVRTRIAAVIALLTAAAMTGAGILVYALESARIERAVNDQIEQEIAEFRNLRVDPNTGRPFDDVGRVLNVFLTRNVPDDDEMLVGYVRGEVPERTANRYGQEVLDEPDYQDALAELADAGGTRVIESPTFGETWVTLVPVTNTQGDGALVIVNFLRDEHEELDRTLQTYALIALLSLGLITTIAAFQSGRLLAPLRTLEETAREITATDLSRRIPERGNDDITALTRTINGMLERLDAGFAAQRQFLDDAGHELKTPLTVVRGHLELLDHGDAEDLAETRELLLDEVDRMSRLVGDLVLLAKSRRHDFLVLGEVDVDALTRSVLAKATALGEREWRLDGTASGRAVLDEQRVTQALLQLADNAVKHTDPGSVVAVGSAREDGEVRLWVRDGGDGIPPEDREAVLERFGRSTVRAGDDGFGLGLSIVRAIADAHGGVVRITDAEPRGAHVEIVLPDRTLGRDQPRPARQQPPHRPRQQPRHQPGPHIEETTWPRS
ncbi:HAMP domain-containing sensor histidine kinase [Nocardioides sp. S-58]|uniref:histidine kinase n=1 Tax=Nocardioides renjunii TaxID=3095075 RepID=A0ABU5K9H7_9ACTN|nr:HAMP domain-containing sensor histidine kinase [Nocardioides sp. S-58]MDZ5661633.1 HAMP domain-containing sensor histidine kinase [Nocardioides sp. S-58]